MLESTSTADLWRAHPAYGRVPTLQLAGDPACTRLVVVSAHPGDESRGAGGLIATAAASGLSVYVVLLTAGETSPYATPTGGRHALATLRLAEMENALARLAPDSSLVFLRVPDGEVAASQQQIDRSLTDLLGDASRTLLAAPWRHDGEADHEAAGRAAAAVAPRSGARLIEYPLAYWQRGRPEEAPWCDMVRLDLSAEAQEAKAAAIRAHVSQIRASAAHTGGEAPLPGHVLAHHVGEHEHYLASPT